MDLYSEFDTRILWAVAGADQLAKRPPDIIDPVDPVIPWRDLAVSKTGPVFTIRDDNGFREITYLVSGYWRELELIEPRKLISIALIQLHPAPEGEIGPALITGNLLPASLSGANVEINDTSFTGNLTFRIHGNLKHSIAGIL